MGDHWRGEYRGGGLRDWLGEHIQLSLVGHKLEAGAKLTKLVLVQVLTVPGCRACGLAFWGGCRGQSSLVIYCLVIVCFQFSLLVGSIGETKCIKEKYILVILRICTLNSLTLESFKILAF